MRQGRLRGGWGNELKKKVKEMKSEKRPKDDWKINPEKTGLVVIDMQRGFVDSGAPLECVGARELVPKINKLEGRFPSKVRCRIKPSLVPSFFTSCCVLPKASASAWANTFATSKS